MRERGMRFLDSPRPRLSLHLIPRLRFGLVCKTVAHASGSDEPFRIASTRAGCNGPLLASASLKKGSYGPPSVAVNTPPASHTSNTYAAYT